MKNIVIVSGARTPIGTFMGSLKDHSASDLGALAIKEALIRANMNPEEIDEVVFGCIGQVAEDAYVARVAAVKAGIPIESSAMTINRLCASGVQSIITAAMEIQCGAAEIVVAGGTESMTNYQYYLRKARSGYKFGDGVLQDGLTATLNDPFSGLQMGVTAENIAEKFGITRKEQDEFAYESQKKAAYAMDKNLFEEEILPIEVKINKNETRIFKTDEHPRPQTTIEKLSNLKAVFKEGGTVTPGNSSGINDGAAAVVLMSEEKAKEKGLKPIIRIVDSCVAGVDPGIMGTGPIPAVRKLLQKTEIKLDEIGLVELNEAFAAQSIACIRELGLDMNKINVNGGAIALGHPLGATGAILTVKLMHDMKRKGIRYGLETLCIGGGQGLAVIYELIQEYNEYELKTPSM